MVPTLFVVADKNQAQLYRLAGTQLKPSLEEIGRIDHRDERDSSATGTRLKFVDTNGSDAEREKRFVRQLVDRLRDGVRRGEFRRLYVAAPAQFVGTMRGLYGSSVAKTIEREIIGDYTHQTRRKLEARVQQWIN